MAVLLGLLAALSFGSADYLARFSTRWIGVYRTFLYMQLVGLIILTVYVLVTGQLASLPASPAWQGWVWGVLAGGIYVIGNIALYQAFAVGQLSVVAPIASSYAAVTVVLSLLSGETLSVLKVLGIVLVLIGVVLAALRSDEGAQEGIARSRALLPPGVGWAIVAALGLGVSFWLLGFVVRPVLGQIVPIWLFRLTGVCIAIPLILLTKQKIAPPSGGSLWLVLGIGVVDMLALVFSIVGFATGQVAIVSVLTSLYSVVSVILAWIFLKERLNSVQWSGILVLLVGIVLTNL